MRPSLSLLVVFWVACGISAASALRQAYESGVGSASRDRAVAQKHSVDSGLDKGTRRTPSVLVIVFSRRDGASQRALVRDMWMRASASTNTKVRFGICHGKDNLKEALATEHMYHGDLTFLQCPEGYDQGRLTKKALAALKVFVYKHKQRDFFMKVDDDSFVSWPRLHAFLHANGTRRSYMGVPIGTSVPCRNSSYRWYEPYDTFNGTLFPPAMAGGSGYILGRHLAEKIIHRKIAHQHLLYNEDRAVGVWVDEARKAGADPKYQGYNGIDGHWSWDVDRPTQNWQRWMDYPYLVHHGLRGETIACLAVVEWLKDPSHKLSRCFEHERGRTFEKLVCYTQTQVDDAPKENLFRLAASMAPNDPGRIVPNSPP